MSRAVLEEVITQELGCRPGEAYGAFEEDPFEVGLLSQSHRACLLEGQPVTVRVAHPGQDDDVTADLASLFLLRNVFFGKDEAVLALDSAIADFRQRIQGETDFGQAVKVLGAIEGDAEECKVLCVPRVFRNLSTGRLLTLERLPGWSLQGLLPSRAESGSADLERRELASRLCTVWLRQALLGRFFPAAVRPHEIWVLPDYRLAFPGIWAALPSASKKDLWEYLLAASTGDPDVACTHLFRLLEKDPRSVHEDELRHRVRQAVPFRDSKRAGRFPSGHLGELVLVHWQFAQAQGCRLPFPLAAFYRAFIRVHEVALQLAPRWDCVRDGLDNVRVMAAFGQFREIMSLAQVNESLERYAPVFLDLPKRLNQALTLMAQGRANMQVRVRESAEKRGSKNATAAVGALFLVLAGMVLVVNHLVQAGLRGSLETKIGVGVVVVLGVFILGRLSRTR
jgi:ubiquinone biosynthesis protein